ncbi:dipeptidase [Azorhizobium oxalatiphilum]|uniref:Dipeptidase n=1 Tax=Azorhizobium oxalatiphilum TaxID=980631 RepID=A0A917F935_9HYPH|nr:Xaa-Pro peptidase family protein [Azorhizobium oxalatiphilum]GGF54677.1 dipeptidase [Azorhizobium oxalatiphilum]
MISPSPLASRRTAVRHAMQAAGIDLLLIGPSAGFRYFAGRDAILTERFVALGLFADGQEIVFSPRLQAPLYEGLPGLAVCIWDEAEPMLSGVAAVAQAAGVKTIAVNTEFWSGFLLQLTALLPGVSVVPGAALVETPRLIKSEEEIAALQAAADRIDAVWSRFCAMTPTMVGRTELELRAVIDGLMREEGFSEVSWVDVGAGANGASSLHHGSDHVIQPGEPVVFDYAGCFEGYYGDICRVAVSGAPDPEYVAVYDIVRQAQEAAFRAVRPGVPAQEIDAVGRRIIADAGYGERFTHRLGHGIGLAAHEGPYLVAGNTQALEPGMTFSDEPGIYIPGRFGVRIEDIIVVTQDGARRLTQSPRDLVRLS